MLCPGRKNDFDWSCMTSPKLQSRQAQNSEATCFSFADEAREKMLKQKQTEVIRRVYFTLVRLSLLSFRNGSAHPDGTAPAKWQRVLNTSILCQRLPPKFYKKLMSC